MGREDARTTELMRAVRAVVAQARGVVRHDDAERTGVCIHAGLLRTLAEAAGLDPLPISPSIEAKRLASAYRDRTAATPPGTGPATADEGGNDA